MANLPLGFCFCVLLSLINLSDGKIHNYNNQKFTNISNGLYVPDQPEALYASEFHNLNAASSFRNRISFIRFDNVTFVRTKEAAAKQKSKFGALVETIVFDIKDKERVGGSDLESDAICCTTELADAGSCSLGEVIIRRDGSEREWPKKISTFFEEGKEEVRMATEDLVINRTGVYNVYFVTCDKDLEGIVVRGRSVWKSLGGYLPGDEVPLMYFYLFMNLAYVVLGLVWSLRMFRYRKNRIYLHSLISLVIGFTMSELLFMYSDFANLDATGTSPDYTILVVTLSSAKKTLSRLLLLFLCSGYGIVKPSLGGVTLKMLLAGVLYFGISEALVLAILFKNIYGIALSLLCWPILETCFFQWIFKSLWRTIKQLKLKKMYIDKLQLYKKFARVLVYMVVLNFFWINVELYVYDSLSEFWQVRWIIPAFSYLLSYALLVFICFYWAPTEKPTRYLYIAEMEDDKLDEEDELLLTESGMKTNDNDLENGERKTILDFLVIVLGNVQREEYEEESSLSCTFLTSVVLYDIEFLVCLLSLFDLLG